MKISMATIGGRRLKTLAGALNGRQAFGAMIQCTVQEPLSAEPLYLDFDGVDIATASYLRESVLRFRDAVRRQRSNLYPVVANANAQVVEELTLLAQASRDVLMTCSLDGQGRPSRPLLLGELDPMQKLTFDLVDSLGETDASELMRDHSTGDNVRQTAWNNRLSALAGLGLVIEISQGRTKRYRRLFEEGIGGN